MSLRITGTLLFLFTCLPSLWSQWTLIHPEEEPAYIRQFLENSGNLVSMSGGIGQIDWTHEALSPVQNQGLSSNTLRFGTYSAWFWKVTSYSNGSGTVDRKEFKLYHIRDVHQLVNPDFDLEQHRVLTEPANLIPQRIEDSSESGDCLLVRLEPLDESPTIPERKLYFHDEQSGLTPGPATGGIPLAIAGNNRTELYIVIALWEDYHYTYSLQKLTENGLEHLSDLDLTESAEDGTTIPTPPGYTDPETGAPIQGSPRTDFQIELSHSKVVVAATPYVFTYSIESGELNRSDGLPLGVKFFATTGSGQMEFLVTHYTETGIYDITESTFYPKELPGTVSDAVYNPDTGEWTLLYNLYSIARTTDFENYQHINRSEFGYDVDSMKVIGNHLYAIIGGQLWSWDEVSGWADYSDQFSQPFYSIDFHDGLFYLGGRGCIYSSPDLQTFEAHESDLLSIEGTVFTNDEPEVDMIPAAVEHLSYKHDALWVVLQTRSIRTSPRVKILRSTNLENWEEIGSWDEARLGFSANNPYFLIYDQNNAYRLDTRTSTVETIPFPEGYQGAPINSYQTQAQLAGIGEEFLALVENERNQQFLIRHRPNTGWQVVQENLEGRNWSFVGLTDRYYLQASDYPRTLNVETIHGDYFLWTEGPEYLGNVTRYGGFDLASGKHNQIYKRTFMPSETFLPDNQFIADDWWLQDEWGFLNMAELPWVYSPLHGWLLFEIDAEGNWLVKDHHLGWLFTSENLFPLFFSYEENNWILYQVDSTTPYRWFYYYQSGTWQLESD